MIKRLKIFLSLVAVLILPYPALANSYIEMITTAPKVGQEEAFVEEEPLVAAKQNSKPAVWYDSRITTSAPVVSSPYPKYYAWQRAQMRGDEHDEWHEGWQNLIYTVEGGLVGWGLYEMFRHH